MKQKKGGGGCLTGMSTAAKTNGLAFGSRLQMRLSTAAAIGYISIKWSSAWRQHVKRKLTLESIKHKESEQHISLMVNIMVKLTFAIIPATHTGPITIHDPVDKLYSGKIGKY